MYVYLYLKKDEFFTPSLFSCCISLSQYNAIWILIHLVNSIRIHPNAITTIFDFYTI